MFNLVYMGSYVILPVFIFVLLILFIIIKLRFNQYVNCWFCKQWTKVPKHFQNSWVCPSCDQYNGFTKDGDYNIVIAAQQDELLNKSSSSCDYRNMPVPINGFCNTCNKNQELKVQQIAMFAPTNEKDFDKEFSIYKKQLERNYELCSNCELVLQNTLRSQKSIHLSQYLELFKSLNNSYQGITKTAKRTIFLTAIQYIIFIIVVVRIFEILKTCDFSQKNLTKSLPSYSVPYVIKINDAISTIDDNINSLSKRFHYIFWKNYISSHASEFIQNNFPFVSVIDLTSYLYLVNFKRSILQVITGASLQITFILFNKHRKLIDFVKFTTWIILLYVHLEENTFSTNLAKISQLTLCTLIILLPSSNYKKQEEFIYKKQRLISEKASSQKTSPIKSTSTPKKTMKTDEKMNNPAASLNTSLPKLNLFDLANHTNSTENLFPVFGQKPIFENSLNISQFKCSPSKYRSKSATLEESNLTNESLTYDADDLDELSVSNSNDSIDSDINSCLDGLHLSPTSTKKHSNISYELPAAFRVSSCVSRPKPVLTPPRLQNINESSWVAGGYWKSNLSNFEGFNNLSRSSSQSSGFCSQTSNQQWPNFDTNLFNSLPSSRTNSLHSEFEKNSVLSEPAYQYQYSTPPYPNSRNRVYPNLNSDQQIFIYSKPLSVNSDHASTSINTVLNNSFGSCNLSFSQRPSSRQSVLSHSTTLNTSPTGFGGSNQSYLNSTLCSVSSKYQPSLINTTNMKSRKFVKGSLLKKWRNDNFG